MKQQTLPNIHGPSSDTLPQLAAPAAGGAIVLLEQHTAADTASLDFTTFISSTYDEYMIEIVELAPIQNGMNFVVNIGTGAGPTYDTGNNYDWAANGRTAGAVNWTDNGTTGGCVIFRNLSNDAAYGFGDASFRATGLQSTSHYKTFHGTLHYVDSAPATKYGMWGMQWRTSGTAVTALRFIMSTGNISSGTIRIYGIAKT